MRHLDEANRLHRRLIVHRTVRRHVTSRDAGVLRIVLRRKEYRALGSGTVVPCGDVDEAGVGVPSPSFEWVHMTESSAVAFFPAMIVVHASVWQQQQQLQSGEHLCVGTAERHKRRILCSDPSSPLSLAYLSITVPTCTRNL